MTDWINRVTEHPVHETAVSLQESLQQVEPPADSPEPSGSALARIEHVSQVLASVDPILVSPATLDKINGQLGKVVEHVNSFGQDGNVDHLNNANTAVDAFLLPLSGLVAPTAPQDVAVLQATLKSFAGAASSAVDALQGKTTAAGKESEALKDEIHALRGALATEKSRLDQVIPQQQKQFLEAETSRQQSIGAEKVRIDQLIAQYQAQFSESQDKRQEAFNTSEQQRKQRSDGELSTWRKQFTAVETGHQATFAELTSSLKAGHEQLVETLKSSSAELISDIEIRRDKAKDLVGIIAGTGMAGGYQRDADAQRKAFVLWNVVTIAGFAGLIGFAVWLFVESTREESFEWTSTAARFVAIAAFGLFSAYAGRMAMRHRESERQQRHKQLALESVNSFLEDLPPEDQRQVKQKMADAFFTQQQGLSGAEQDVAPTTIEGLLKLLTEAIKQLGK